MNEEKILSTVEEVKAYNDPYRMKILYTFYELRKPATVKEISDIMGEVPAKVHYHIKKMEKAELVKLVYRKEINGIIAKYYEPIARSYRIQNKYLDQASKDVMVNEIGKAMTEIFDNEKNRFIQGIMEEKNCKDNGYLQRGNIYLNEDEVEDLYKLVYNFLENKKNSQDGKEKYRAFITLVKDFEKK